MICGVRQILQIEQNVPVTIRLTLLDDSVSPAVPIDLTGKTVFISVKEKNDYRNDDTQALITSSIVVHPLPLLGITDWILTKTETYVKNGSYKADVRVFTDPNDYTNTDEFLVDIVPVVTRRIV